MKTININQLTTMLNGINAETPAKIKTSTIPGMRKTNNPYFGEVTKEGSADVVLCFNYEKEVNRKRALEGKEYDFKAGEAKWGAHLSNTPLITNNGQLYLQCEFKAAGKSNFLHKDQPIDKTLLTEWLQESKPSAAKQGLADEHEIVVRTYKLASIKEIELNGEIYQVK